MNHKQHQERPGRSVLPTIALFVMATVAALIFGEVVVRIAVPVRNVGPTFSEYDPLYGKRLKKSFSCVRTASEFTMHFSTNSLGFRGPEPPAFPSGGILFLGDSFTSGYGVNDGEEFPALIRRRLAEDRAASAPPVVNAGSGNTGNGYWLRFLDAEAERYRPRLVVLGFCVNDFADNSLEQMYEFAAGGTLNTRPTPHGQEGARTAQAVIEAIPGLAYSHLVGLARQVFSEGLNTSSTPPPASAPDDTLTYAIVDSVFRFCAVRHLPAIMVIVEVGGERLTHLRTIAERYSVPFVVAPAKRERPDLYYRVDGHWNATGHAAVTELMMEPIRQVLDRGRNVVWQH